MTLNHTWEHTWAAYLNRHISLETLMLSAADDPAFLAYIKGAEKLDQRGPDWQSLPVIFWASDDIVSAGAKETGPIHLDDEMQELLLLEMADWILAFHNMPVEKARVIDAVADLVEARRDRLKYSRSDAGNTNR